MSPKDKDFFNLTVTIIYRAGGFVAFFKILALPIIEQLLKIITNTK